VFDGSTKTSIIEIYALNYQASSNNKEKVVNIQVETKDDGKQNERLNLQKMMSCQLPSKIKGIEFYARDSILSVAKSNGHVLVLMLKTEPGVCDRITDPTISYQTLKENGSSHIC
jgi:hypothetical protein